MKTSPLLAMPSGARNGSVGESGETCQAQQLSNEVSADYKDLAAVRVEGQAVLAPPNQAHWVTYHAAYADRADLCKKVQIERFDRYRRRSDAGQKESFVEARGRDHSS